MSADIPFELVESKADESPEVMKIGKEELAGSVRATIHLNSYKVSISFREPFVANRNPLKDRCTAGLADGGWGVQ